MEAYSFAELVSVAHCSELISTEKKTDHRPNKRKTMLEDVLFQPEMLQVDEISRQISPQIFDFCDHELFLETLQNSEEVTSSSNCCYEDNSSYPQTLSLPQDLQNNNANTYTNDTSFMFDPREDLGEVDDDIAASIDFSVPMLVPPGFEEDCLSTAVPTYLPMNPSSLSCSFLGPAIGPYLPALSGDGSGLYSGGLLMASELQTHELDYPTMQRVFNPGEFQALGSESQQLIGEVGNSASLAPDIPNIGDQTFKVGKLSVEQRKEKIHRYMKKRNERNFSKKIKYACRKTLADSRPRVRGRFAKNDDFGETSRAASSNHEEDDEEEVVVKEEEDMVDSSDIFAHISGVNSFKCNYPIQSWI